MLSQRSRRAAVLLLIGVVAALAPPAHASPSGDAAIAQARRVLAWRDAHTGTTPASFSALARQPDAVPGSLLVTTTDAAAAQRVATYAGATWANAQARTIAARVTAITVDPAEVGAVVSELRAQDDVIAVEPNVVRRFAVVPDDPLYAEQWAHQMTAIEAAWDISTGSADVLLAVADSGVVASHPDLGANVAEQVDAGTGDILPGDEDNDLCRVGHGTWVAGILGAIGDNGIGVAGTNWDSRILDINTADPDASCDGPTDVGTVSAIVYAARQGADVVNLSLGAPSVSCPVALQAAIDQARDAGTVVVAAAGNAGDASTDAPASCNGVISVGATGPNAELAPYTNRNAHVDVVAPGGGSPQDDPAANPLTTSWWAFGERTPEYIAIAGTSFAAPYVTGLVGLLRSVDPDLTPNEIESILESTAADLEEPGRDDATGWGQVQADAALALAAEGTAIPAPEPDPLFPVGGDRPGGDIDVFRVAPGTGVTEAVTQAVAVSATVFSDGAADDGSGRLPAQWGVIARSDDYADALAGSALTLGAAPLLFTAPTGPLAPPTATELRRVLPEGATVYLLGGPAALPATLEEELEVLGFEPVRLAGAIREQTAVAIADEIDRIFGERSNVAILANREDWPDAVGAGQLGSQFAFPVYLTPANTLDPSTEAALADLQPDLLYVVGGTVRISEQTAARAGAAAGLAQASEGVVRLAGEERNGTIVAVSAEVERILASTPVGYPRNVLAVNVRRSDAFAHLLSATVPVGAFTGVFVPIEGDGGDDIPAVAAEYARGLAQPGAVMGDVDLISDETLEAFEQLLETPGT